MLYSKIRKLASQISKTPLHPQWLMNIDNPLGKKQIGKMVRKGTLLDVGCSDKSLRSHISSKIKYIGLDYLTTTSQFYETRPHIY